MLSSSAPLKTIKSREHLSFSHPKLHTSLCEFSSHIVSKTPDGECYGFGMMGMYAILCDDIESFVARFLLFTHPYKPRLIERVFNNFDISENAACIKLFCIMLVVCCLSYCTDSSSDSISKKEFQSLPIDAHQFLWLMNILQDPRKFSDLFPLRAPRINQSFFTNNSLFFAPASLENEVRKSRLSAEEKCLETLPPVQLNQFSCNPSFMTVSELADYLKLIQETIDKSGIKNPIAIRICSEQHTLTLGYFSDESRWFIIDGCCDISGGKFR